MPSHGRRKVVIAVDMSKWAEMAFDWYVENVHICENNEVICYHSVEMSHQFSSNESETTPATGSYAHSMHKCEENAKQVQDKFNEKMKQSNIDGRVVVKYGGRPGESIVQFATAEESTMIVMGTRGLGFIRRTILGSVSDYVLHHAHCPVAVCSHNK